MKFDYKKSLGQNFLKDKNIINKIVNSLEGSILIMGRNNKDKEKFFIEETENIRFLTIHKSKGLEFDNTIIVCLAESLTLNY